MRARVRPGRLVRACVTGALIAAAAGCASDAKPGAAAGSAGEPRAGTGGDAATATGGHAGTDTAGHAGTDTGGHAGTATRGQAGTAGFADGGAGGLCPNIGWCQLTDTKLASVCPDPKQYAAIQGYEGCGGVINDWSGGVADTKRNRLLIWGGGHHGYYGNELYALDLNAVVMRRLDDPSDVAGIDFTACTPPEAYADGRPSSRHTYDGLAYVSDADLLYTFAGAGVPCGYGLHSTWTLDLTSLEPAPAGTAAPTPWRNRNPNPYPTKAAYGLVADYDPSSKKTILNDGYNLWSYDSGANRYELLNDSDATNAHIDYHMTGRVDPKRKLFVIVGGSSNASGGLQVFDIGAGSNYTQQNWTAQAVGCDLLLAANSPGLAYDAKRDRMIGWAGGDDVFVFDSDTKTCTKVSYAGGPGPQNENGTFGRFRYFPALNLFAVVNTYQANAYALRLAP